MDKRQTNVCKGIAIFMMYFHHLFYSEENFVDAEIVLTFCPQETVIKIARTCQVCVAIFVFLTGYDVTRQFKEEQIDVSQNMSTYIRKQMLNLLSDFWFVYVVAILCGNICFTQIYSSRIAYGNSFWESCVYMIIDSLGLADAVGTPSYNATWWYMSLAICLVFIVPLMIVGVERLGFTLMIGLVIMISLCMADTVDLKIGAWLFSVLLGIVFAFYDIFEKIPRKWKSGVIALIITISMGVVRSMMKLYWLTDAVMAVAICYLAKEYLTKCKGIGVFLENVGVQYMNLILAYSFVSSYFFHEFTYSWKYPLVIWFVLLMDTLLISLVLEYIKKVFHYQKYVEKVMKRY